MRAVLLALALTLSACAFSSSSSEPGGPPAAEGDDDADGIANANDNCRAVANADQVDGDGDQVGDECDNCKVIANPRLETFGLGLIQRDHDGDGRGDACDGCPHLASAAPDVDADGDGIGAACDPDDSLRNSPALWNGFYDPPDAAEWSAEAGSLSDWELVQSEDKRLWWQQRDDEAVRRQLMFTRLNFGEAAIATTFQIVAVAPAGTSVLRSAGTSFSYIRNSTSSYYFTCGLRQNVSATPSSVAFAALYQDDAPLLDVVDSWIGPVTDRDVAVFGATTRRNGGGPGGDSRVNCGAQADTPTVNRTLQGDSQLAPDGRVGLRTFGMKVRFDYLFVVDKRAAPATLR
jgi:Thrombospondin type 3 repeat